MSATPARGRGFTLVELMTVVALVAVLAAIAVPSFRQLIASQRIRGAVGALDETLWLARAEATKRNRNVGFLFSGAATAWSVPDPDGAARPLLRQDGFSSLETITENGGPVQFSFNPYGRLSSGAGWIQLGLASSGVYQCVTVSTTGRTATRSGKCS